MQTKFSKSKIIILTAITMYSVSSCNTAPQPQADAIQIADMDTTTNPANDFYHYVNGGWLKNNPIPPEESSWSAFSEVDKQRYVILKEILESAAADTQAEKGSNRQKVGDFYFSGMDSVNRNNAGIQPLSGEMEKIEAVTNIPSLMEAVAHLQIIGARAPYGIYVDQDMKNSTHEITYAYQGGIGLPDRDYYFRKDSKSEEVRNEYKKYIASIFTTLGSKPEEAKSKAEKIFSMETVLAGASMTNVQLRDPYASYNKMSVTELTKLAPEVDWKKHLSAMGINEDTVIIGQPEFFKELNKQLKSVSINDWKDYLRWNLMDSYAPFLDDALVEKSFQFHGVVLSGVKEMRPQWKRVLNTIDGTIGEALGAEYVKKAFPPESKERMNKMIDNMIESFRERIKNNTWMGDSTKTKAYAKLDKITRKIGYPDKWIDYSLLEIDRNSFAGNVMRANEFRFKRIVGRLGKPVDRTEWSMTPPTVNAYYNPSLNEIVFPAGILQPPFFNHDADDALNYGGIGAVICHELTHGFDDQGSQFDGDGNLVNWWTDSDRKNFDERAKLIINQFNNYIVLDSLHVNGELTQGENIADLGGVMIAYDAFKKTEEGKSTEKINGFTPDQRFFISWATVWRTNIRNEALRQRVLTNPHAPGEIRSYAPLTNMPQFYAAFHIKEGDKMWRADSVRVVIW